MGVACGYVGEVSVWAWLGVQCGGVASVWAWLVGSVWAVPQCCPAVLIGVEAVGGRGLWVCGRGHSGAHWRESGQWAWPVGMWAWSLWVWLVMQCGSVVRCSMGVA